MKTLIMAILMSFAFVSMATEPEATESTQTVDFTNLSALEEWLQLIAWGDPPIGPLQSSTTPSNWVSGEAFVRGAAGHQWLPKLIIVDERSQANLNNYFGTWDIVEESIVPSSVHIKDMPRMITARFGRTASIIHLHLHSYFGNIKDYVVYQNTMSTPKSSKMFYNSGVQLIEEAVVTHTDEDGTTINLTWIDDSYSIYKGQYTFVVDNDEMTFKKTLYYSDRSPLTIVVKYRKRLLKDPKHYF